jgi:hypothetical protein
VKHDWTEARDSDQELGDDKVMNFFSRKPLMENFLHLIDVRRADAVQGEWPQLPRAVIG